MLESGITLHHHLLAPKIYKDTWRDLDEDYWKDSPGKVSIVLRILILITIEYITIIINIICKKIEWKTSNIIYNLTLLKVFINHCSCSLCWHQDHIITTKVSIKEDVKIVDELPNRSCFCVSQHSITSNRRTMISDLLPEIVPPNIPGVGIIWGWKKLYSSCTNSTWISFNKTSCMLFHCWE